MFLWHPTGVDAGLGLRQESAPTIRARSARKRSQQKPQKLSFETVPVESLQFTVTKTLYQSRNLNVVESHNANFVFGKMNGRDVAGFVLCPLIADRQGQRPDRLRVHDDAKVIEKSYDQ